jgi:histidyl-tRNA synthetase
MRRDFNKQIKYAVDKDIRFLLIVGKKELLENSILLQDRDTKERIKISINNLEDIYRIVKNRIGSKH